MAISMTDAYDADGKFNPLLAMKALSEEVDALRLQLAEEKYRNRVLQSDLDKVKKQIRKEA